MKEKKDLIAFWKKRDPSTKAEIKQALEAFKKIDDDTLTNLLTRETKNVFECIDCLLCANCCKTTPPIFLKSDVKRIAKSMKMPPKIFVKKFLIEDIDGTLVGNGVPCSFLKDDNTCMIYEGRPKACRDYPHTDDTGFKHRNTMNYKNTEICPAAFKIVQNVKRILKT